jgi:hypothetical protein
VIRGDRRPAWRAIGKASRSNSGASAASVHDTSPRYGSAGNAPPIPAAGRRRRADRRRAPTRTTSRAACRSSRELTRPRRRRGARVRRCRCRPPPARAGRHRRRKPAFKPKAVIERKPPTNAPVAKPCALRCVGRRRQRRRDAITGVVAHAVLVRIAARENAGVRGERDHRVRVRELEARTAGGEAIEIRRRRPAAVAAEGIGTQRVDGDEQDVAVGRRGDGRAGRAEPPPAEAGDGSVRDGTSRGVRAHTGLVYWLRGRRLGRFLRGHSCPNTRIGAPANLSRKRSPGGHDDVFSKSDSP